jgi:hypothetical protein
LWKKSCSRHRDQRASFFDPGNGAGDVQIFRQRDLDQPVELWIIELTPPLFVDDSVGVAIDHAPSGRDGHIRPRVVGADHTTG